MACVRATWIMIASFILLTSVRRGRSTIHGHLKPQPDDYDPKSHENWKLFDTVACGSSASDRIVGGYTASLGKYPWLARLGYFTISYDGKKALIPSFRCGGALITERYVVTAAHCAQHDPKLSLELVRLGEFDTNSDPDCVKGVCADKVSDCKIDEIHRHQSYNDPRFKHDIALLRLEKKVKFTMYTRPICMTHGTLMKKNFVSQTAEVAGWGVVDVDTKATSMTLQALKIRVQDLDECDQVFNAWAKVGPTQLCAGGRIGQDSCAGDSGGPLMKIEVLDDHPPRYFIIGVVSFGAKECAVTAAPAIYTNLAEYLLWMLDRMKP